MENTAANGPTTPLAEKTPPTETPAPEPTTFIPDMPPAADSASAAPIRFSWQLVARWLLVIFAAYCVGSLLLRALPALTPFILGLILAYLLLPIVNRLSRTMPRWSAILLVYVVGLIVMVVSITSLISPLATQTRELLTSVPSVEEIEQRAFGLLDFYRANVPQELREPIDSAALSTWRAFQTNLSEYAQGVGGFLLNRVLQLFNTVSFIVGLLIIPIWLFYVLNDEAKGRAAINNMLHPVARADFWNVWSIINAVLSNYVRGQLILGLAVGAAVGIGLTILGLFGFQIPYVLLLAVFAGITELVPIIGPIIGAIPAVVIGLTIAPATGVAVLILYIGIQQLENNFLVPRIVGESIGIHPAVLTVVLIAMGQVFGLIGVILSAPVAAIARDLFVYAYERLSGSEPAIAREAVHEHARNEQHPAPAT